MRIIEVVPYSDDWHFLFEKEKSELLAKLPLRADDVHHIGSTSVQGMAAKPVIDILIEVPDLLDLDGLQSTFKQLGYDCKGEFGIKGRRHYQKGGDNRSHHIHAYTSGSQEVVRHLAFRDYLRAYPQVAREYSELKLTLLRTCANDINLYGDGKSTFVNMHEKLSLVWHESANLTRK